MLNETIDYLNIKEDGVYVDCTLGGAGHALYLLNQLNDEGRLIAIDQDLTAIENAKEVLKEHLHKVTFVHNNFRELTNILKELNIEKVDGIYYDLGVSSPQLDVPERGFSYHHDAKLDMRMDQTQSLSAYEVVNEWSYEALVKIFIVMEKRSSQSKLLEELKRIVNNNRLRRLYNLSISSKKAYPRKQDVKAVILLREFFKQFE